MNWLFKPSVAIAGVASIAALSFVNGQAPVDFGRGASSQPVVTQMVAQATPPVQVTPPEPPKQVVDETALRYFARQGDTRRLEAEIARLKALYPDWVPPADPLANDYVPDPAVENIWQLYSKGDFAGARAAIAQKKATDPAFVPSEELLHSLDLGEAIVRLRNASDAKQYETVISIAATLPELLTCANVDVMWRLADAFISSGNKPRGTDVYTYLLTNCTVAEERLATMQKASVLLDRPELDPLLALERKDAAGVGEFAPIRLDLARNAIASVLTGKVAKVDPSDVDLLRANAKTTNAPEDLRLLGWYALNQKLPAEGLDWFEMAMKKDPSILSAHGLGVALLDLRKPAEAEAALADYRDESPELTTLYLSAAAALLAKDPRAILDPEILARITSEAVSAKSAVTARELGWYAYAYKQPQTAADWFRTALAWDNADEESAYGLLVASDLLKDAATVKQIKASWGQRSPRIATFGTAAASQVGIEAPTPAPIPVAPAAVEDRPVVQSISTRPAPTRVVETDGGQGGGNSGGNGRCTSFLPPESLSPGAALNRGWCLMDMQRATEAAASFGRALQSPNATTRRDAAYGQALAFLRLGLTRDAIVAAAASPQSEKRIVELQAAILSQTATSAYDRGDYVATLNAMDARSQYAAEQNDLLTLRAYAYFNLKRYREAEQIFSAVAATGYRPALEGLATVRAARGASNPN